MTESLTIGDALDACGLNHLKDEFDRQKVSPDLVGLLSNEELINLGIVTTGDRLRLKRACESGGASALKKPVKASAVMRRLVSPTKQIAKKQKTTASPFKSVCQVGIKVKRGDTWVQMKSTKANKWINYQKTYLRNDSLLEVMSHAVAFYFPNSVNAQLGEYSQYTSFLADYDGTDVSTYSLNDLHVQRGAVRLYLHIAEKDIISHHSDEEEGSVSSTPRELEYEFDEGDLPDISTQDNDADNLLQKVEGQLREIVGLKDLKDNLRRFARQSILDSIRRREGLLTNIKRPVMVFSGNPGTGKTSVASIVAEIMFLTNQVKSARLVTVQRDNLVSNHIGETAIKTASVIEGASGGTLLIDEAYRLTSSSDSTDFGREAVETLMSKMEGGHTTTSDRPAFIFAGYPTEMDSFLKLNPGFSRRVTHHFRFPDYETLELADIFLQMCRKQNFEVIGSLSDVCQIVASKTKKIDISRYNAGFSSTLFYGAKEQLDERLFEQMKRSRISSKLMKMNLDDIRRANLRL